MDDDDDDDGKNTPRASIAQWLDRNDSGETCAKMLGQSHLGGPSSHLQGDNWMWIESHELICLCDWKHKMIQALKPS